MNRVVDMAIDTEITTPIGILANFPAKADQNETICGANGNVSLGTSHDHQAGESYVVREVVDVHEMEAQGVVIAR